MNAADVTARGEHETRRPPVADPVRPLVARGGRVLLALPADDRSCDCALRALALSRLFEAELHVAVVVESRRRESRTSRAKRIVGTGEVTAAGAATRAWLEVVLGIGLEASRVAVLEGAFAGQVAAHASDLDVGLVVVPFGDGRLADAATEIALQAGTSVLVPRASTAGRAVVAATDLKAPGYPVLEAATGLAARLRLPVVAVHNHAPSLLSGTALGGWVSLAGATGAAEAHARLRLERASQSLSAAPEPVMATNPSTVAAILHEAKRRDADLVVVGARPHRLLRHLFHAGTAEQVVREAQRSVLVTPIDRS